MSIDRTIEAITDWARPLICDEADPICDRQEAAALADKLAALGLLLTDERQHLVAVIRIVEPTITAHLRELSMDTTEDNALLGQIRMQWKFVTDALDAALASV